MSRSYSTGILTMPGVLYVCSPRSDARSSLQARRNVCEYLKERGERFWIEVLGRPVPATNTDDGIRAVRGRNPIDADCVRHYLEGKFGDDLKAVRSAMQKL